MDLAGCLGKAFALSMGKQVQTGQHKKAPVDALPV